MLTVFDLLDAASTLRVGVPVGLDGPGLALAMLGLAGWLRWVVMSVRRALDD